MFGRRNSSSAPPAPKPQEPPLNLELLPDVVQLPPIPDDPIDSQTGSGQAEPPVPAEIGYLQPNIPEPTPFVLTSPQGIAEAPGGSPSGRPQRSAAESVIGPDDFFDGNYRSERGVRIQGTARGAIESRQYIVVEAGATVEANLSAEDITVAGRLSGQIECRQRLEVKGSGVIQGKVKTALLVVQEGGVIDGELHMEISEAAHE